MLPTGREQPDDRPGAVGNLVQKRLTLFFDGDQLKRALTDFMPAAIPPEPAKTAATTR